MTKTHQIVVRTDSLPNMNAQMNGTVIDLEDTPASGTEWNAVGKKINELLSPWVKRFGL